jgi:hypothetical protein
MTIRTESRITIANSVSEVWAYLSDVACWPKWAPTVLQCAVRDAGPLRPGARIDQRARAILGLTHRRSQQVTAVEAPRRMSFAGPMGTSAARWGMQLEPAQPEPAHPEAAARGQTDALMWIEVDLAGLMRAIPARLLKARIQRVSDLEMTAIKAAVDSTAHAAAQS